jgi:hypothetical protein
VTRTLSVIIDGQIHELAASPDASAGERATTANLILDGVSYYLTDLDGDGAPDVLRVRRADDSRALLWRNVDSGQFEVVSDTAAGDDSIDEGASHWFAQATPYTCGPAAITMVLADLLDLRISNENAVWTRAVDLDAITDRGMRARDIEKVINSYGIAARTVQTDALRLESLLEQGHEAIIMVDADEYWPGFDGRGENDVRQKRPHAVRVLGIDNRASVAVLSDSGLDHPTFGRLTVPLEHLNDAWADLDWLAVITTVTHHDMRERLAEMGAHVDQGDAAPASIKGDLSTVILPFTVRLSRLVSALRGRLPRGR